MVFPTVEVRLDIWQLHTDTLALTDVEPEALSSKRQQLRAEHLKLEKRDDLTSQEVNTLGAILQSLLGI